MKIRNMLLSSIGALLLLGSNLSAEDIKTDYDHNVDFGQFHTYTWGKVRTEDPLFVSRIKSAVDSQLSSKGWTRVEANGDVSVTAVEMAKDKQSLDTFYNGYGGGWRWGGGFGTATTTVETYEVGTLVIDMFNAKTKALLWRGSAMGTLSDKPDKNIKNLDKNVKKMFEHFPPEPKK